MEILADFSLVNSSQGTRWALLSALLCITPLFVMLHSVASINEKYETDVWNYFVFTHRMGWQLLPGIL